ncbi:MAG TPA: UvrD-helicase domain-containing protein, partial [Myxococcota bacterium]|nr:UvrD-helicase domain-containing protein [Myxococcota bacterium]
MKQAEPTNRIFDPRDSLVVVAGAGTGKTYNLVRRYLTLIATTNPDTGKPWSKPSEVLAITFTRAAAAEMRSRVISLLRAAADATGPGNFSVGGEVDQVMLDVFASHPDYDRLIAEINAAPIDTIHGLCARLLREFPELSGVPVDARPVEPAEASVLVGRFLTGFLDRLLDISDLIAAGTEPDGSVDPDDAESASNLVELLKHFDLKSVRNELGAMLNQSDEIPSDWFSNPADCRIGFLSRQWCFVADKLVDAVASALKVCEDYLAANPRRDEISLRDLDAGDVTDTEILSEFVAIKLNLLAGLLDTLRAVREGDFSDCSDFSTRLDALADEKVTGVEGLAIDRSVHLADVPGLVDALA